MSDPTPNVERFARLEALFHEALEKPAAERAAFLDARCAGDAGLRAEIDRWLRGHDAAGSLFLRPAAEEPALPDLVGRQIGRYRIDRLIAAGGMGVVYEATQEAPHRTVAIKLLRRGLATASERRRFELEAEILARVRHPAVAQVLEAGTTQEGGVAVPWFALELVPGARPITDYANEKRLSVRERLLLFAEVCDAVAHGHANGIVHRDIKPGNVLVDSSGRPKVIDFGVARVFDSDLALGTRLTSESHVLGTLEYMSPEQCVGDSDGVDVRSDVYSLGVLLYELVCGTLPFALRDKSLGESLRIVREDPPRRPSSIRRELSGDLEAIVLKAIAKERERRYASANELV
ncbi:MAG: serine/threonine protein kinase [Planctomycetes bacterium]|nr:serine/threonine protein kinase [Planctomycetota bacterium]